MPSTRPSASRIKEVQSGREGVSPCASCARSSLGGADGPSLHSTCGWPCPCSRAPLPFAETRSPQRSLAPPPVPKDGDLEHPVHSPRKERKWWSRAGSNRQRLGSCPPLLFVKIRGGPVSVGNKETCAFPKSVGVRCGSGRSGPKCSRCSPGCSPGESASSPGGSSRGAPGRSASSRGGRFADPLNHDTSLPIARATDRPQEDRPWRATRAPSSTPTTTTTRRTRQDDRARHRWRARIGAESGKTSPISYAQPDLRVSLCRFFGGLLARRTGSGRNRWRGTASKRVGRGIDLLEFDVSGQHRLLPLLVLGLPRVELGHHLASE